MLLEKCNDKKAIYSYGILSWSNDSRSTHIEDTSTESINQRLLNNFNDWNMHGSFWRSFKKKKLVLFVIHTKFYAKKNHRTIISSQTTEPIKNMIYCCEYPRKIKIISHEITSPSFPFSIIILQKCIKTVSYDNL